MPMPAGQTLLQEVGERIIVRRLQEQGHIAVTRITERVAAHASPGVDITYSSGGRLRRIKVKVDAYYGDDLLKIADRSMPFYRADAQIFAFEAISNSATREPGWMFNSEADELYYYYLTLLQTEEEIQALASGPDEVFFSELGVGRDDLRILPMKATMAWFQRHYEDYTPRPVTAGEHSAWYRLIPREVLELAIPGAQSTGEVFSRLRR